MKRLLIILIFMAICCADAAADIYNRLDKNGFVTYTDLGRDQSSSQTALILEKEQYLVQNMIAQPKAYTESRANTRLGFSIKKIYIISAFIYFIMSLICLLLYRSDKQAAISGNWRKPESTLHLVELLGGWPGGFIAQRIYRHKTQKKSYQIIFWAIVSIHIAAWTDYIFLKSYIYLNLIKFVGNQLNRLT